VNDIRRLKYCPTGEVFYNTEYNDNWDVLPQRRQNAGGLVPERLYSQRIAISERKWMDLQELKTVIEKDAHLFYDNLPYE